MDIAINIEPNVALMLIGGLVVINVGPMATAVTICIKLALRR